ncbi:helix-turn-helix transcriptional regulator [uncultured Actinomyces sp.]|uniref:helix-turn-helix domain-containing protein n=1 Tax=uncultured Actinomyces sp. TaxID=249061 RepID=UPI00288B9B91|nr:helix-turn-helix transcriptional regulator [uncultured Actinomyces sp.]
MSPRNADHHEPDDPDIAQTMRARREELGLSVSQMSKRAGVSVQTWRNYESGRSRVRADKQDSVWDALGWESPSPWSALRAMTGTKSGHGGSEQKPQQNRHQQGGPGRSRPGPELLGLIDEMDDDEELVIGDDDDIEGAVRAILGSSGLLDELAQGAETLHLPGWDEIPTELAAGYSPRLAGMLGEKAARCFAMGAFLYDQSLAEDLDGLGELPRGTHLGELEDTHIGTTLPNLWLTRYDYEFVFQMRRSAQLLCLRLTGEEELADDGPLVRSMAEALALHDVFDLGCTIGSATHGVLVERETWEEWVDALSGPDRPARRAIFTMMIPPADSPEHFDNWFAPFADPFVPDWGAQAPPESDDGVIVVNLARNQR